ncbi:HAMP domain-containing sensor histidine kinase [Acetobacterium sp.]|uniref:HAMP domain-containing sensor histidine kinase n=1 Tax=Acetobacterium sp. TaxID=1872094 RepID=UPI002F3EAA56
MTKKKFSKENTAPPTENPEKKFFLFSRLGFTLLKYMAIAFVCAMLFSVLVTTFIKPWFTMSEFWSIVIYSVLPCIFMLILLISLLGKKIHYINEIQKGIQIIEGGSMDYTIPIRGHDELSSLARSINEMRRALDAEIKSQEKAKRENQQLITSVSHDIRTPLTSIVCYLELIQDGRVRDPVKEKAYLNTALEKAYQIKGLITSLFEHALADNGDVPFHFETYDGNMLISQIVEEITFSLKEGGFQLVVENCIDQDFSLTVDLKQLRRIFDNLVSNILKYADPKQPVDLGLILNNKELCIIQRNKTIADFQISGNTSVDSSGIGLATCKRIIVRHLGKINYHQLHHLFKVELSLPVQQQTPFESKKEL